MNPEITSLPVVVLYPHSRCNCRCLMCDIWKGTDRREIGLDRFERYLDDFEKLAVQWVVFSGGEPLMHTGLSRFCELLRARRIRTTILSTGLLVERHAPWLVQSADDLIVSLDGPPAVHDAIRGVPGAFQLLERGVRAILALRADYPVTARSTVQRQNHRHLRQTAQTAQQLGLRGISFLAADVTSSAFNRPEPWGAERQAGIALGEDEIPGLEEEVEALQREWGASGFVTEGPEKLRRIVQHFRAHLGLCRESAPVCNAPWVSAVIEADGTVRPCFFHDAIGHWNDQGLAAVLNGTQGLAFRANLDVETNPTCLRCVCSLNWR